MNAGTVPIPPAGALADPGPGERLGRSLGSLLRPLLYALAAPSRLSICLGVCLGVSPGAHADEGTAVSYHGYRVLQQLPHPRENFVQGLQLIDGELLLGTGGYGESRLRRYSFPGMALLDEHRLPARFFGEGVTRLGDRIYQLTWRAGLGIIYRAEGLEPLAGFRLRGEGWGLTHNGEELIYSDGSDRLFFLDPQTLERTRVLDVRLEGEPVTWLNELEWVNGRIWANVWRSDRIVIITPDDGSVEAVLELEGLLPASLRQADTDVLNGIAHEEGSDTVWVTGKRWPLLFEIEPVPPLPAAGAR